MRGFGTALLVLLFILVIGTCGAVEYTGSLNYVPGDSSNGLVVGGDQWSTYDMYFSWDIRTDSTYAAYPWLYTYTFYHDGIGSGVGHVDIETSPTFTLADMFGLSSNSTLISYGEQKVGKANPTMPENIYGLRLEPTTTGLTLWTFSFWSDRAPVWGDFYIKDGGNPVNYANNLGFTTNDTDPTGAPTSGSNGNHILRPDSVVPEPGTILAALMLLSPAALMLRRRRPAA